jgi:hypothetical protein
MSHHDVAVAETVPVKDTTRTPTKLRPQCCEVAKTGPVWWEDRSAMSGHGVGWTMIQDVVLQIRSYYLCNLTYCPFCGSKLPVDPNYMR